MFHLTNHPLNFLAALSPIPNSQFQIPIYKMNPITCSNTPKKKPLSDERLTDMLQEKGYNIARRTVAKYREQLNIPVARLRKQL